MKLFKPYFCSFVLLLLGVFAYGNPFPEPLSPRTASYKISLALDAENKEVTATQKLTFINPSEDTIWTMPFHMYYNAFKNNRTTFMSAARDIPSRMSEDDLANCRWSWIAVTSVKDEYGNDLTANMEYVQPYDQNENDATVLEIKLKVPILPKQTYSLDMEWHSKVPKLMIRTGYSRDFFFMVQWFPKLGVYEAAGTRFSKEGGWNCHQYHARTEYYGEFGVYDVEMIVPNNFKVGASGFLVKKEKRGEKTSHRYLAEDVIDFAWTANPDFLEFNEDWKGTNIRLLITEDHAKNSGRFLEAAKNTLAFFEEYLEKYPYPTLTIVSPPYHGLMAGAMEYPTLITAPTFHDLPKGVRMTETLTIHELVHQYFMQMVSTNEQEEPWMDEGFTSFFEGKILDKYYEGGSFVWDYMGISVGGEDLRRGRFLNAANIKVNPMSDFGWHFENGSYSEIVYGKAAVMLRTIEGMLGEEDMQTIMQTYFSRWKFKHPGRQDFFDVVNEVAAKTQTNPQLQNLDWFFEQAVYGTEVCDYSVYDIQNKKVTQSLGYIEDLENCETPSELDNQSNFVSKVTVFRNGEMIVPQEILVTFDDGKSVLEFWDGKDRSFNLKYEGRSKVVSAVIDPDFKISLDKNIVNNSFTLEADQTGIWRYFTSFLTWMQQGLASISTLV